MFRVLAKPRYVIVWLCFLATFSTYVERVGFSIAFTRMAKKVGLDDGIKGTVLSAFYWGYALSQIPGGALAHRIGGRPLLLFAFAAWSLVVYLTPTDARSTWAIIFARVVVGVLQGLVIPSVHTILSEWIPANERAMATSLTTSGMYLGSAAAMWILPSIAEASSPDSVLLTVSCLGSTWTVLWYFFGGGTPLLEALPLVEKSEQKTEEKARRRTPWKQLLSSAAIWCIVANSFTFHYAVYMVMNWLPTYFTDLLHAELAATGGVKTLPYFLMFIASNIGGWLGGYLIASFSISVAAGRKIVNTVGFLCSALGLFFMARAGSLNQGMFWTTVTMGSLGFSRGGFSVNHMDIAPRFAGIAMGISNTAGTLSGVIGVAMTGWILELNGGGIHQSGWIQAFMISAVLCLLGSVFFIKSGKGTPLFD